MSTPHRVVIVGGGFGGLYAAKSLGKAPLAGVYSNAGKDKGK